MPRPTLGFAARRRRALRLTAELEPIEHRSTVTPIGAAAVGLGLLPIAGLIGDLHAWGGVTA